MNSVRIRSRFYEVLVHETTHAFVGRYLTNRPLPRWLNEGLAEYMSAKLVPQSVAEKRYTKATKKVLREKKDVAYIIEEVGLNELDYGVAQSLVRFLIARDRKDFIRFGKLIKKGTEEQQAMEESFGLSQSQLLTRWRNSAAKFYRR